MKYVFFFMVLPVVFDVCFASVTACWSFASCPSMKA